MGRAFAGALLAPCLLFLAVLTATTGALTTFPSSAHADLEDCSSLTWDMKNPSNPVIELNTTLGNICIELLETEAPNTVANFLYYVEQGDFDEILFHRKLDDFIVQTGNFYADQGVFKKYVADNPNLPNNPYVINEPCTLAIDTGALDTNTYLILDDTLFICSERGNERGTLAMAKIGDPACNKTQWPEIDCVPRPTAGEFPRQAYVNSASRAWFINLADNRANLDNQNGGFSVFARVLGNGMDVADTIADLPVYNDVLPGWEESDPQKTYASDLPYSMLAEPMTLMSAMLFMPVMQFPTEDPAGYGCFDADNLATVEYWDGSRFLAINWIAGADIDLQRQIALSGACGTQLNGVDITFDPSHMNDSCVDMEGDWLGSAVGDFYPGVEGEYFFTKLPATFYSFDCDQRNASAAGLALRREDMSAKIAAQAIHINSAIQVPEPSSGLLGLASLLCVSGLARLRRARNQS